MIGKYLGYAKNIILSEPKAILEGAAFNLSFYAIPTVKRMTSDDKLEDLSFGETYHTVSALLYGLIILGGQAMFYYHNPEFLAVPISTNIVSQIYENTRIDSDDGIEGKLT